MLDSSLAVAQTYPFRALSPQDGLPHPSVYALLEDRFGFLWVGTFAGAARYDGTLFERAAGLAGEDVRALLEDGKGRLWFASNGGVARFSRGPAGELLAASRRTFTVADGLPGTFAQTLVEDREGHVWAGFRGGGSETGGLARLDDEGSFVVLRSGRELPASTIWCSLRDRSGDLWFGTRGDGVFRLTGTTRDRPEVSRFAKAEGLSDPRVFGLAGGPDGAVHAATSGGVFRFEENGRFTRVTYGEDDATSTSSLAFAPDGTLWVGRYGAGLVKSARGKSTAFLVQNGLESGLVTALLLDRDGTLWIAAQGGGLSRLVSDRFAAIDRTAGWPGGGVSRFLESPPGVLWAGGFSSGLVRLEGGRVTGTITRKDGLADDLVRSLLVSRDGSLWVGTSSGLSYQRPGQRGFTTLGASDGLPDATITALAESGADREAALFIGTTRGLARRDPNGTIALAPGDVSRRGTIEALAVASDGTLWVGTARGLVTLRADGQSQAVPGVSGRVLSICFDRSGATWCAGDDGLLRIAPDGQPLTRYGVAQGLPGGPATAVVTDRDGAVWAGTSRGVARFSKGVFVERRAMPYADVNADAAFLDARGRLWWGTPHGPVVYDPESDRPPARAPPALLRAVTVESLGGALTALPLSGVGVVPSDGHRVTFRFVGLSPGEPERVLYRTRLEGFDRAWSEPSPGREVSYTSLPPGRFRFEVQTVSREPGSAVSESTATVDLVVPAPWWRRPIWLSLLGLVLVGSPYVFHRVRVRRLQRRTDELERLVADRTAAVRREADRTRVLLNTLEEGILLVGDDRRVELSNPVVHELVSDFPAGQTSLPASLLTPDVESRLSTLLESGEPFTFRLRQAERTLQLHGSEVLLEERSPSGLSRRRAALLVLVDVTELLALDRMKGELVSTISHELRTPLTAIGGALSLARSGLLGEVPPEVSSLVDVASRNTERLSRLVNDILDVERLDSGTMVLTFVRLDASELAARAVQDARTAAHGRSRVELRLQTHGPAIVKADGERLSQVLEKLISNAVKFSPESGVVTVGVSRNDRSVRLSVSDQGPGVPEEFRERLFGAFARHDASDSRDAYGTGLGLAISKGLVEKHGGRLRLEASGERGSTFVVELPAADASRIVSGVMPVERARG